jgi:cytochrome c oxidase assembly factor CtaG
MTTWQLLWSCWQPDPIALAALAATGASVLATRGRGPAPRALPLGLALVVLCVALLSPVGQLADGYLFSAHMLQHLLLVLVVPPLALLGLPRRSDERAAPGPRVGSLRRVLAMPAVAWGLGVGAMWLWHAPTLCDAASRNAVVHRTQELSLLIMGTAFWWPIQGPRTAKRLPPLGGIVYLFTACTACTLLGILITFSPVQVCSVFAHPADRLGVMPLLRDGWGLTPDRDQEIGGLLMWVPACLVYGLGIMGQLARLFHESPSGAVATEGGTS